MRRFLPLLLLLALLALPAHAAPQLRLNASVTRTEYLAGERFTIAAFLFNDGDTAAEGTILITAPGGFELLSSDQVQGEIAPKRALSLWASYQVASDTVPGLYTFVVEGGGQVRALTIRVGPVRAPPAEQHRWKVYLPVFL